MAEKNSKKGVSVTNIIFLVGIIGITLFFIIFTLFMVAKPFAITKYDQMKEITFENLIKEKTNKHSSYYVFVYDNTNEDSEELTSAILSYANYARTHTTAEPIYLMNAKDAKNKDNSYTAPTLVYVASDKVSTTYTTYSKIFNQLSTLSTKK